MNALIDVLAKSGLLKEDLDYQFIRASMVIIFCFSAIRNGSITRHRS